MFCSMTLTLCIASMHLETAFGPAAPVRNSGGGMPNTLSSATMPNESCRPGSRSSSAAISTIRRMQSSRYLRSWWKRMTAHSHKGRLCVSVSPSASQSNKILADSSSSRSKSSATRRQSLTKSSLIAYSSSPTLTFPSSNRQQPPLPSPALRLSSITYLSLGLLCGSSFAGVCRSAS